jgi:pyruvate dehydrogenase E2 component (dihydrolipoamide acetyltransferase)
MAASAGIEVRVPDIGDFKNVPIIQILVAPGDVIKVDDPIVTLESEKASIDVPAPAAGRVRELKAVVGDRVSQGTLLLSLETEEASVPAAPRPLEAPMPVIATNPAGTSPHEPPATLSQDTARLHGVSKFKQVSEFQTVSEGATQRIYASPSVRALARHLGVNLVSIRGSGPRARIVREDVQTFVKTTMLEQRVANSAGAANTGQAVIADSPVAPSVDFVKYGPTECRALSRIQKISGTRLAHNWAIIPHVTNFDEADITELESFRNQLNKDRGPEGLKLSVLPFLIKTCALALRQHVRLNASLEGDKLVLKKYCHIGFAADTSDGLLVPVIRDADTKGVIEIAREAANLAAKARENKLKLCDMEGGCFTVSSLGGIGGTGFTPIINAPEVAILGAAKARMQPRWDGERFVPRLILPLALSWDHRALDGAIATRFLRDLTRLLSDLRLSLL